MNKAKTVLCFILCVVILCSCGQKEQEYLVPVNFYYCNQTVTYNSPAGVISPEVRESVGFEKDIVRFMDEYLSGPSSDELYTIIPANTVLCSAETRGTTIQLNFSKELADLSGIELTTASLCIAKSLNEFAGIKTLVITAEDSLLDERESFTISLEDIVTMDAVTEEE